MQRLIYLFSILLFFNSKAQETWTKVADFPGIDRYASVGFTIGEKGYIITGYHGYGPILLNETWEYDPGMNQWTQKTDFPGSKRWYAASFSVGNKGYVGTGDPSSNDFYEYDPNSDTWTRKADFPGALRWDASAFSIGTKGYIGTGRGFSACSYCYLDDFFEYDPSIDTWTEKASFPGGPRSDCATFTIGNKGYFGGGETGGNNYFKDLWEYEPVHDEWTQKSDFPGIPRTNLMGFSVGGKGYVGMGVGINGSFIHPQDQWKYDPLTDQWDTSLAIPLLRLQESVQFTIGDFVFAATGNEMGNDCWKFYSGNQPTSNSKDYGFSGIEIFPNPAAEICYVTSGNDFEMSLLVLRDLNGKEMKRENLNGQVKFELDVSTLGPGLYFIEVKGKKDCVRRKLIVR